jgi:hypothetical protein
MLNDKNEVIGFQTASGLKAIEKKLKGTGVSHTEYRDPNDGEKPTFVKGEFEYTVNEFKSSFATPVSDLEGDAFSVAVCVQNKKGELEYKARKVLVNNTKAPASSADAPVADKK